MCAIHRYTLDVLQIGRPTSNVVLNSKDSASRGLPRGTFIASFIQRTYKEHVMDDVKDIQNSSALASFLGGFSVKTSPFGMNSNGERLFRRAEAVVSALHLVTNHVPLDEPIRKDIRHTGLTLLSDILAVRDDMRTTSPHVREVQGSILRLIADVRVLTASNLISLQNAGELVGALDDMGAFLANARRSVQSESLQIIKDDLALSSRTPLGKVRTQKRKGLIKDIGKGQEGYVMSNRSSHARSEAIMKLLSGGEMGIKDIATHLPEYSEKMIQRQLLSLVSNGKVRKTGSKRWSRYSIPGNSGVSVTPGGV